MVTEAGKELLRATINTAKFHNRILEENEMWKQWELECGLTMMVSDDDILKKIRKNHMCSKHRRKDRDMYKRDTSKSDQVTSTAAGTSKDSSDRWDHSGFLELYPNGVQPSVSSSKSDSAKWDHSGFHELYPDKAKADKYSSPSSSKSHSNKHKKKKRKHHRRSSSTSDNEIYEEFKRYKRSKTLKHKNKSDDEQSASGFDNHVKEWKKIKHKS